MVRSFAPWSRRARIRFSGIPHRPKPDIMTTAPSGMSRTASAALLTTLFMGCSPVGSRTGRSYQGRGGAAAAGWPGPWTGPGRDGRLPSERAVSAVVAAAGASRASPARASAFALTSWAVSTALGTSPPWNAAVAAVQASGHRLEVGLGVREHVLRHALGQRLGARRASVTCLGDGLHEAGEAPRHRGPGRGELVLLLARGRDGRLDLGGQTWAAFRASV